jgi:hypothetical protein
MIQSALCASQRGSLIGPAIPKCSSAAMNTHNHPGFYRQLGKEPKQTTQGALETSDALRA